MTADAIDSWKERAGELFGQTQTTAIAAILTETARRSMILVDDCAAAWKKDPLSGVIGA